MSWKEDPLTCSRKGARTTTAEELKYEGSSQTAQEKTILFE